MPTTISSLLDAFEDRLRPAYPFTQDHLERPISWVHSSDLSDPTRWLESHQMLLTDGGQFRGPDATEAGAYCARLSERGLAALGFAVDVIHPRIPDEVVAAARANDLPLVEVSGTTPFISVIRHVADTAAADRGARLAWTLESQRAVARAAVQRDGLRQILKTLSRRLDTWVALYDGRGRRVLLPGLRDVPRRAEAQLAAEAGRLLQRGSPSSSRTGAPDAAILQTIGRGAGLRGVLAVGTRGPLDAGQNDLVDSVIALASVALEHQRAVSEAGRSIRTGVLHLLRAGQVDDAARSARAVWGGFPEPPALVGVMAGRDAAHSVRDELEQISARGDGSFFFAEADDELVFFVPERGLDAVTDVVHTHDVRAGFASLENWKSFERAIEQATYAARSLHASGLISFEEASREGLMGTLLENNGRSVAARMLAPLDALDPRERTHLLSAARAWFVANTAWDPAARELGIHRHTLRSRIEELGSRLGIDLDDFGARAQLWVALELVDPENDDSHGGSTP